MVRPDALVIEVVFEGDKLSSTHYVLPPPGSEEARAIAPELDEAGYRSQQGYRDGAPRSVVRIHRDLEEESYHRGDGEEGGQEVDKLCTPRVSCLEMDTSYA